MVKYPLNNDDPLKTLLANPVEYSTSTSDYDR
jgi:hypothetical protein